MPAVLLLLFSYIDGLDLPDIVERPCFANRECAVLVSFRLVQPDFVAFLYYTVFFVSHFRLSLRLADVVRVKHKYRGFPTIWGPLLLALGSVCFTSSNTLRWMRSFSAAPET